MKKTIVVFLFILFCASLSQAQQLIGGRASGMGGAGVAATDDISAAYYNPAALMRSNVILTEVKVDLGAAYTDVTALSNSLAKASDPAQFLLDNYSTNLSFSGSLNGLIGLNLRKIGLSVIPLLATTVTKPANSVAGTVTATGFYEPTLTLGTTFSVPFLPAALDVGVNAKQINPILGSITTTGTATNASGVQTVGTGSGMGYDLGLLTTFDIPFVSKLAVGVVMRDISASYTRTDKQRNAHIDQTTGKVTYDAETTLPDKNFTLDSSTAIGAYTTIPGIGLGVAADIEMTKTDTNTHIGIELPLLFDTLFLRAGVASGPNLSLTTVGAEIDLRILKAALTTIANAKNTSLTTTVADISFGF